MVKRRKDKDCEKLLETLKKQGKEIISAEEFKEARVVRKKRRKKKIGE